MERTLTKKDSLWPMFRGHLLALGFLLNSQLHLLATKWDIVKSGAMHSLRKVGVWMSYQPMEGGKFEPNTFDTSAVIKKHQFPSQSPLVHLILLSTLILHTAEELQTCSSLCMHGIADTTQHNTTAFLWMFTLTKYEQHGQPHSPHLLQTIPGSLETSFLKYESIFYILL